MEHFINGLRDEMGGKAADKYIITKGQTRISIITPALIRIETQPDGKFCDLPTQAVLNRSFDTPDFTVTENGGGFTVKTRAAEFVFSSKAKLTRVILEGKAHSCVQNAECLSAAGVE